MSFGGITNKGNYYLLDERTYNNKNLDIPIAPSDTARNYYDFLERNRIEWGFAKDVFIDSADSATITELNKFKREALRHFESLDKSLKIRRKSKKLKIKKNTLRSKIYDKLINE